MAKLKTLVSKNVLYRVGVDSFRWVHRDFITPWVVNSYDSASTSSETTQERPAKKHQVEKPVQYLAKVWRRPTGEVDLNTLFSFMSGIIGFLVNNPGVKKDAILGHFSICAPATQLLEVLELLDSAGCIITTEIPVQPKLRLFSSRFPANSQSGHQPQMETFYEASASSLLILSHIRAQMEVWETACISTPNQYNSLNRKVNHLSSSSLHEWPLMINSRQKLSWIILIEGQLMSDRKRKNVKGNRRSIDKNKKVSQACSHYFYLLSCISLYILWWSSSSLTTMMMMSRDVPRRVLFETGNPNERREQRDKESARRRLKWMIETRVAGNSHLFSISAWRQITRTSPLLFVTNYKPDWIHNKSVQK